MTVVFVGRTTEIVDRLQECVFIPVVSGVSALRDSEPRRVNANGFPLPAPAPIPTTSWGAIWAGAFTSVGAGAGNRKPLTFTRTDSIR